MERELSPIEEARRARERADDIIRRVRESMRVLESTYEREIELIQEQEERLHVVEAGIAHARSGAKKAKETKED